MEKIDKGIEDFLKKFPAEKIKEGEAFKISKEYLKETYGENVEIRGLVERVLFVRVSSPVLRNEMEFKKMDILREINRRMGEDFFLDIKFEGLKR